MVGRLLETLLARLGYDLVRLETQERERSSAARELAEARSGLASAQRELKASRRELERLRQAHGEEASRSASEMAALWGKLAKIRADRDLAREREARSAQELSDASRANDEAQARLWGRINALRSQADAVREQLAAVQAAEVEAGIARSAEAEASAAAQLRLWARVEELQRELARVRLEAEKASSRSDAAARQHTATLQRVWSRLDQERTRLAASRAAAVEDRKRASALERELATANRRLARSQQKLETIRAQRAETAAQLAALKRSAPRPVDTRALLLAREKLEAERAKAATLKIKLQSEQKRAARLAAELARAKAEARANRLEADRAGGQEQRLLSELALGAAGAGLGGSSGDASDAAVAWLAKSRSGRRSPEAEAAEQFRLGRSFQAQGAIGLAAACFRRAGPYLQEFLAQDGPDGDRVSGPDFLVIGAARAGTTWLKKSLAHHPQVFILAGEHHYFSTSSHLPPEIYVSRFARAHSRFQRPGSKVKELSRHGQRLYGEKSTTYLAMPQAQIDLCAALFPKARMICLVRDPAARVWSHLKHLKMRDALQRLDKLSDLPPWMEVDELIRQGRYEEHLLHWARRFDPEQILLIDFERIAREPETVYADVLAHIGAAPSKAPQVLDDSNRTESVEMPPVLADRLREAFAGERFDIPHLRAAMQRAAEAQRGAAGARRRPAVRMAGSSRP